jgi:hypothetical protein
VDSGGVRFHFIVTRQVETFFHPVDVALGKKRANVLRVAGSFHDATST